MHFWVVKPKARLPVYMTTARPDLAKEMGFVEAKIACPYGPSAGDEGSVLGRCMLTTAEHEYTRYGFRRLIQDKAVDILQPDVTWMGGITEARRITAMASAYDILVIPHGSSVYSYQLQYAFTNCPVAELINLSPQADRITPYFGGLFLDEPLPKDGFIDLPDKPGSGVTLNREGLKRPYARSADEVIKHYYANAEIVAPTKAHMPF
mmetsp:Transcript_15576/g.23053  ORF Transcript_15576/g.23053 Transcript_15576/m.23053 type:complete len:207 (+) Transcript_15576:711-1331(+)